MIFERSLAYSLYTPYSIYFRMVIHIYIYIHIYPQRRDVTNPAGKVEQLFIMVEGSEYVLWAHFYIVSLVSFLYRGSLWLITPYLRPWTLCWFLLHLHGVDLKCGTFSLAKSTLTRWTSEGPAKTQHLEQGTDWVHHCVYKLPTLLSPEMIQPFSSPQRSTTNSNERLLPRVWPIRSIWGTHDNVVLKASTCGQPKEKVLG